MNHALFETKTARERVHQNAGMVQQTSRGLGRALAEEQLRADIGVKLHLAIQGKASHRAVLESAFARADGDKDGILQFHEFCSAAAAIGLGVSEYELRQAFERFDRNHDGTVEFAECVDFMCPVIRSHADAQKAVAVGHLERMAANREKLVATEDIEGAVFRVAETVFAKELNVRRAFQTWDANGSGDLDVSEFTAALNSLGFSLDLLDAKALFEVFDIDRDGRIKCWEFIRTLGHFERELNGDDGTRRVLGHNTGRGGGGDRAEGGARPVLADVIGASGGNTIRKPTMAERSRLQQDMERQQKEEAARAAAAMSSREEQLHAGECR